MPPDAVATERRVKRILGAYNAGRPGPLLVITGGIHGNERGGVEAARRVVRRLEQEQPSLRGRLLALAGNLTALERGERYVDSDLNRMWSHDTIGRLQRQDPATDTVEEHEQRALLQHITGAVETAQGPVLFLDLHSASAHGPPFCLISDTIQNRRIAFPLGIPVILGLEETISSTTLSYFGERGHIAIGVEGGQHTDPKTADLLEAVIWIALVAGGLLDEADVLTLDAYRRQLREASYGFPRVVEIIHRHDVQPEDHFQMKGGFLNFMSLTKGQALASDRRGEVRAPTNGLILLPLYQGLGNDGYFVGQPVHRFWLRLSVWLRRLRMDHLLPLFPGVRKHPAKKDVLLVNPGVARWFVVEIFHLFGFRRCSPEGGYYVFSRRPEGAF